MNITKHLTGAFLAASLLLPASARAEDTGSLWYVNRGYTHPTQVIRIHGNYMDAGKKNMPALDDGFPTSLTQTTGRSTTQVLAPGLGVDYTYFITDNIGVQAGVSLYATGEYNFTLTRTAGATSTTVTDTGDMKLIPVSLIAQYYPAPYGAFQPYMGFGYNYMFLTTSYSAINVSTGGGPVAELGMDWWLDSKIAVNLDLRRSWINMKVDYSDLFTDGTTLSQQGPLNPWIVQAGLTFAF